jgi:ABC-2 type transport system ATP-binding protein
VHDASQPEVCDGRLIRSTRFIMDDFVRVSGLSKHYGPVAALADVSFSIRTGEILGLIGPNGAGKTTLFECVAGVLPASGGSVFYNGHPMTPRERSSVLFYLPDAIAPWPSQTVRWAFDFAVGFFGARAELAGDVSDALALTPLLTSRIGTLSKGQRKRVMLGIGLIMPQPLLLTDEPFDGLDLRQSRDVAATLRAHAARGRTLFLSIHQIADAARICDRFVLLSGGHACGEGTLEDLSALARARGASPSRNDLEEVFLALT